MSVNRRQSDRVSRRRMLQTAIALTTFGSVTFKPFRRVRAASSERCGLALCIGLNSVNPNYYGGWSGLLAGCKNDSDAMAAIASNNGFYDVKNLQDGQATKYNVRRHIAWAASELRPGDIFMLTCSSHGSVTRDLDGDEASGEDQTICLYDGQWVDDDRASLWGRFAKGVRIVMVADLCHSGTTARAREAVAGLKATSEQKEEVAKHKGPKATKSPSATREEEHAEKEVREQTKVLEAYLKFLDGLSLNPPDASHDDVGVAYNFEYQGKPHPIPIRTMPAALALKLSQTEVKEPLPRSASELRPTGADGLLLAACQDSQVALDGSYNGLFTSALLKVWDQGRFQGKTYNDFCNSVKTTVNQSQHMPNLQNFGIPRSSPLASERPFQVK